MIYPNLIYERRFGAISTIADFVDTTEERIEGILKGTIEPANFEKRALCRFYGMPYGYLFNRDLQKMRPDKFQHREKMLKKIEQAKRVEDLIGKNNDCTAAKDILNEGLRIGIAYADYRRACFYISCADYKAKRAVRDHRVRFRLMQEESK